MAFAHGPGLDLCPRLKALKDRHLFLPRGCEVPQILKPICEASLDFSHVPKHWDRWVHLIASAYSGHTSAINVLARFGSAARGDPLYEVGVVIGRLLRTHTLRGNRNSHLISGLHEPPLKSPGNSGCFYRMLLHQNQGDPYSGHAPDR
jgi:hypothetical protein